MDTKKIRQKIMRDTAANIKKHGQSVVYVGAVAESDIPFHYTVGRTKRGLPELLLTGPTDPETGMRLLNALDRLMPTVLPSGSFVNVGGKYPVLLLDATDPSTKEEYTCLVSTFYAGDPECQKPYSQQRLLGKPEI